MKLRRHTIRTLAVLATGLWILGESAYAASFDCSLAKTRVEVMICADPALSELDLKMANGYAGALNDESDPGGKRALQLRQKEWLKQRNACKTPECTRRTYQNNPFLQQGKPRFSCADLDAKEDEGCAGNNGKGGTVCQSYLNHLNSLKEIPYCEVPQPSSFNSPQWEEFDVLQHMEWAYQIDIERSGWPPISFEVWRKEFLGKVHRGAISPEMKKAHIKPLGTKEVEIIAYTRHKYSCDAARKNYGSYNSSGYYDFLESQWYSGHDHFEVAGNLNQPLRKYLFRQMIYPDSELMIFSGVPYFVATGWEERSFQIFRVSPHLSRPGEGYYETMALCFIGLSESSDAK